jgi:hypothetical protein
MHGNLDSQMLGQKAIALLHRDPPKPIGAL